MLSGVRALLANWTYHCAPLFMKGSDEVDSIAVSGPVSD